MQLHESVIVFNDVIKMRCHTDGVTGFVDATMV